MASVPSSGDDSQDQTLAKAAFCTEAFHFFAPHARDLMGRLLRSHLDMVRITPTELLHSVSHQKKLMATGNVLEAAVQKASLAQVKGTDVSVTRRIKDLHALIETVSKRVRAEEQGYAIEELTQEECLAQLGKAVLAPDSNAKDFRVNRLITHFLQGTTDWTGKFGRVFTLFDIIATGEGAENPRNIAYGDAILGEILRSKVGLDGVLGEFSTLEERLSDIAMLYRGELEPTVNTPDPEITRRISGLFATLKLTSSRSALAYHVYSALVGRTTIASRDAVDELSAIARLSETLQAEKGSYIGGYHTFELLERRIVRTLSIDNLGEKLRALPGKVEQIKTLVMIHRILIGQANKRLVRNYLDYLMEDREFGEKLFADFDEDRGELVRRPAVMKRLFAESDLAEMQKKKYDKVCDELQENYIKNENFFGKLDRETDDPAKKAVYLMRLCATAAFIEGPHLDAARKLIGHYIMQPAFLPRFLAGATTREQRDAKVDDLKRYLLGAGIDDSYMKTMLN